jgi:hypothetical protein
VEPAITEGEADPPRGTGKVGPAEAEVGALVRTEEETQDTAGMVEEGVSAMPCLSGEVLTLIQNHIHPVPLLIGIVKVLDRLLYRMIGSNKLVKCKNC